MPTAAKDTFDIYTNDSDLTINGNVLANDSAGAILRFVDGLRIGPKGLNTIVVDGDYGTFTFKPDGSFTYKLNPGVIAPPDGLSDKVSYKISDGSGATDFDYLVIDIKGAAVKPVAFDDFAVVVDNVATGNVLINDKDPNGTTLQVSRAGGENVATANPNDFILKFIQPGSGTTVVEGKYGFLAIDRDGNFSYTINPDDQDYKNLGGAQAVDHFQYRMYDESLGSVPNALATDVGVLHITVNAPEV